MLQRIDIDDCTKFFLDKQTQSYFIFAGCGTLNDPFHFVTCLKLLISSLDRFSLITEWQY